MGSDNVPVCSAILLAIRTFKFTSDSNETENFTDAHETAVKTICKVNKIENKDIVGQKMQILWKRNQR